MTRFYKLNDKKYPKLLGRIRTPPKKLYYRGDIRDDIFLKCLSVVGSRRMTTHGKEVTLKIVAELASSGITIVSGFMYGIDATAHEAALFAGGKTIAVMPCGLDNIIPAYQKSLYKQILDAKGLIISEYKDNIPPKPWMFIKRNRIVAGISSAVLVIEAEENSGSIVTADYAFANNRKVFVTTNSILARNSKGIIKLLKQGAHPVSSVTDILDYYDVLGQLNTQTPHKPFANNDSYNLIIETLKNEPMTVDDICRRTKVPISLLNTKITKMLLQGLIYESEGKLYVH